MSKLMFVAIGVSVLGGLFLIALIFSVTFADSSEIEFVALGDEALGGYLGGALKTATVQWGSGDVAICPHFDECNNDTETKTYRRGVCISCAFPGERLYGSVTKLLSFNSSCIGNSASACYYYETDHVRGKSCEIWTSLTCG